MVIYLLITNRNTSPIYLRSLSTSFVGEGRIGPID